MHLEPSVRKMEIFLLVASSLEKSIRNQNEHENMM